MNLLSKNLCVCKMNEGAFTSMVTTYFFCMNSMFSHFACISSDPSFLLFQLVVSLCSASHWSIELSFLWDPGSYTSFYFSFSLSDLDFHCSDDNHKWACDDRSVKSPRPKSARSESSAVHEQLYLFCLLNQVAFVGTSWSFVWVRDLDFPHCCLSMKCYPLQIFMHERQYLGHQILSELSCHIWWQFHQQCGCHIIEFPNIIIK